jgi:6-phosphogluconolactonase (cycloisomerase 2 family)
MKKLSAVLSLITLTLCLSSVAFGATEYVIANDDSLYNNALTVFALNLESGTLTKVTALETGGVGLGNRFSRIYFSNVEQAISPGAACIYALDSGSIAGSDIAAFSKATGYARVGNYADPSLNASFQGGSLALTPNGKFLYASYSDTLNIGAWSVNSDCSLTLIDIYTPPNAGGFLKVTPNGTGLIVSFGGSELVLYSIDQEAGNLASVGSITFCQGGDCGFGAVDITKDNKFVIIAATYDGGNRPEPTAFSAQITNQGFVHARQWNLVNSAHVGGNNVPFLSANAYAGSGNLYFGMGNGVETTNFTENPLKITLSNTTKILQTKSDAAIAVTGNILVMAEYPNQIGVFNINQDGSLSELSTTTLNGQYTGITSLSIFPSTR